MHGQPNGLSISYHQNGAVEEISYYLNGTLWNVISRSDSTGKLYNPGTVRNGTGIRYMFSNYGRDLGTFMTYKDGHPKGAYNWQPDEGRRMEGTLAYKKDLVKKMPAIKMLLADEEGKLSSIVLDTTLYADLIRNLDSTTKVIKKSPDSIDEETKVYKYIDARFADPAMVPVGIWRITNPGKGGIPVMTVHFDDYGNPVKVIKYDFFTGKQISEKILPSFNHREW